MDVDPNLYRTIVSVVDDRMKEIKVTRQDFDDLKAVVRELAQAQAKTDQRVDTLAQAVDRLAHAVEELTTSHLQLSKTVSATGSRWGIFVEETFRNSMKEILEKEFGATVEQRWIGDYQVDLVIQDGRHILVEITSSTKRTDLENLLNAASIYEKEQGVQPKLIVATAFISPRLYQFAAANDIQVVSHD